MDIKEKQVINCEHCGNKTPHEIVIITNGPSDIIEMHDDSTLDIETYYIVVKCGSCSEVSLFWDWDPSGDVGNLNKAKLIYPVVKNFSGDVPELITQDHDESKKVIRISPLAFSVLIRRALERVCIDKAANGSTLKNKLDDLAQKGIIPESLAKMANAIRHIGNISAHITDERISYVEAKILDDLFVAIIEYVYIAPAKLKRLSDRLGIKQEESQISEISINELPF